MTKNILKSLRALHGFTQEDMAGYLQKSKATYNRKELGQIDFTLDEAYLVANMFGKTIEEIFFKDKSNTNGSNVN